jgi:hypothetical protein
MAEKLITWCRTEEKKDDDSKVHVASRLLALVKPQE